MKPDPVQLLGCIKAPRRHCQTSTSRTESIEQHIDAMLQQDVTDPEADGMASGLSVRPALCLFLSHVFDVNAGLVASVSFGPFVREPI